jgi:dTDP-4-amino-4,6-dideoxygalactose transaminase
MKEYKKLQEMDRRARELAGLYAEEKKRADALEAELRSFAKIREHYERAKEKHPYFCDMITCLSDSGADTHLDIYRATLAAGIAVNSVEASTVLSCEYYEAMQAYTRGNTAAAVEKCYDAIAVLLRVVDVLEGRQALGSPAKKGGK